MITAVILFGGFGSRKWQLLLELYPKQLLPLTVDYTLLRQTFQCFARIKYRSLVIDSVECRFLLASKMWSVPNGASLRCFFSKKTPDNISENC